MTSRTWLTKKYRPLIPRAYFTADRYVHPNPQENRIDIAVQSLQAAEAPTPTRP